MRSTVGALVTNYSVNGLGQRVAKSGPAGQVEYYYDLAGHLLGTYGVAAAVREEIVWHGDLPIATLQGGATYPIAPDHVGTPYQIVNSANAKVWYWDHHPFGETLGITTVAGFRHELRFPGHIYDSETGLFNNGFRDYWPYLGRYIESDPIGIAGGIGTYSYAGNNPVNAIDPFGLDPKSKDDQEDLPDIDIAASGSAAPPYTIAGNGGRGSALWGLIVRAANAAITRGRTTTLNVTPRDLQKFFTKHGDDFGLGGNWRPSRAADARIAIHQHINSPATRAIEGTYRGNRVTHYLDPTSGVNIIATPAGDFVSGWRLGAEQLESVLSTGRLF